MIYQSGSFFKVLSLSIAVIFLSCEGDPKQKQAIAVCEHFNGADATILQVTDQFYPPTTTRFQNDSRKYSSIWGEFLAFKHNIPVHVFEQKVKSKEFELFLNTGRGGASVYYPSCFIDYRASKLDSIITALTKVYGRPPTTLSYGCGKTHYRDSLPKTILGGRNSSFIPINSGKDAETWYGAQSGYSGAIDFGDTENLLSRASGGRFYTDIQRDNASPEKAAAFVVEQVKKTIDSSGFYINFMHWHDFYPNGEGDTIQGVDVMPILFEAMEQGAKEHLIAKVDYNEAVEYLYAKEAVDSVFLSSRDNQLTINIRMNQIRPVDYSVIKTPVTFSIRKDHLRGLDFKRIKLDESIVEIRNGEGVIYVNIMLDFSKDKLNIILREDKVKTISQKISPLQMHHYLFYKNVVASRPSKFILARKRIGALPHEVEIVERTSKFSKVYSIGKIEVGYEYYCGAIDESRESNLIKLMNY